MLDVILAIWEFISMLKDLFLTIYSVIKIGLAFTFGFLHDCFEFLYAVFSGDLLWLFPLAGFSLGIGWLLIILNRR